MHLHTYTNAHMHKHTYINSHLCLNTYIHSYIHANINKTIDTYNNIHTYILIYVHAIKLIMNTYINDFVFLLQPDSSTPCV